MTRTGRTMLYINLALSLVFMFWGIGLYLNRIDHQQQAKARTDELSRLKNQFEAAERTVQGLTADLARRENRRVELQKFYGEQLENLRTGDQDVFGLDTRGGKVNIDPQDRVLIRPVEDPTGKAVPGLKSLKALAAQEKDERARIRDAMVKADAELAKLKQLMEEIGDGTKPGLRKTLAEVIQTEKNSQNQQDLLRPVLYNRQEELRILEQRLGDLKARIEGLRSLSAARKP